MVIGRENADITLEDSEISSRHAELRPTDDGAEIEDLGSTNGTFVNGTRIDSATPLTGGDIVRVGQSELEVERQPVVGGTVVAPRGGSGTAISETPPPVAPSGESPVAEPQAPAAAEQPAAYQSPGQGGAYTPPPAVDGGYNPPQATPAYTPPQAPYAGQSAPGQGAPSYPSPYQTAPYSQQGPGPQKSSTNNVPLFVGLGVLALLVVGALLYFFVLKSSDEDKIRDVVTEFGANVDDPAVCDLVTQRFLEESSGQVGEAAVAACQSDVVASEEVPVDIEIKNVDINGDRATVTAEADGEPGTLTLEKQDDGDWLIDDAS